MRSGDYHFAAAIRHIGDFVTQGHYVVNCWLGEDEYAEINCVPEEVVHTRWADQQLCGREVYFLFYVRLSFRRGTDDGTMSTPYARDEVSMEAARARHHRLREATGVAPARNFDALAPFGSSSQMSGS